MASRPDFNPDDPATWPLLMISDEVAQVLRVEAKSIWTALRLGTFLPLPVDEKPHRWRREDIEKAARGEFLEARRKLRAQRKSAA